MIAEAGHAALWLAAALALMQLMIAVLAQRRPGRADFAEAVAPITIVHGALAGLSMLLLISLFVRSDMSSVLVYENSHSSLPLTERIVSAWGSDRGAMLLWVALLAVAGAAFARIERILDGTIRNTVLGAHAAIALGFYGVLLLASSPFARLTPAPADGLAVGQLAMDRGWAFYLPLAYAGYAALAIAVCLGLGAAVAGAVRAATARAVRPWVLAGWTCVTIAIAADSYALVDVQGGSGSIWDGGKVGPATVWLAATALFHAVSVIAARGHVLGSPMLSREGAIVIGNVLLLVMIVIVLIVGALPSGSSLNSPTILPAAAVVVLSGSIVAMATGALLRWRRNEAGEVLARLIVPIAAVAFSAAALYALGGSMQWVPLVGLSLAAGLAAASVAPLWRPNPHRTPLPRWGMAIAHLGVAISLAGVASASAFSREIVASAVVGQTYQVGPWRVTLDGVQPVIGRNWSAIEARLTAVRGEMVQTLRPQRRFSSLKTKTISEGSVAKLSGGRLSSALGPQNTDGTWPLTLRWSPLVGLMAWGGVLMALGGLIAIAGHVLRQRRARSLAYLP